MYILPTYTAHMEGAMIPWLLCVLGESFTAGVAAAPAAAGISY